MSLVNIVLWLGGVALIIVGYTRARGPWSRYQALKAQQANVARYESWRGGVRNNEDGPTGASLMLVELRRQAQIGGAILAAGVVLVFVGFLIR